MHAISARALPPAEAASTSSRGGCGAPPAALPGRARAFCRPTSSSIFSRSARRSGGLASSWRGRSPRQSGGGSGSGGAAVVCGLGDFIGADLLGFDLDRWYGDVENYGSIAVYAPAEGGVEGRYATRLKRAGYRFMNITARGLGDPESCLTKIHGVRPPHLGKQKLETFYVPPEVDHRLAALPEDCKGLVLWVIEAKVLSKTELQYLALLPAYRPKVKVIAECGTWRKYRWKPLRTVAGLPLKPMNEEESEPKVPASKAEQTPDATDSKAEENKSTASVS